MPLPAGTGGSENYTIGQVRELTRRGVAAQIVTIGVGSADGRNGFPGVPFLSLATIDDLADLAGSIVFVTAFPQVATRTRPYQMLHIPPPRTDRERKLVVARMRDRTLIAPSRFAAGMWAEFLEVDVASIHVVYPFAEPSFGLEPRRLSQPRNVRVLYAGRLSPEKGIYTLLAMLHSEVIWDLVATGVQITFTATTAGADKPQGRIIHDMLEVHPGIELVSARVTPPAMAALMAQHDIVVMPSNSQYWHETFGIVSIEAQHSGCRVVASADGGLPETDCGTVTYVVPDDAEALARGICEAIALGPVTHLTRAESAVKFTVGHSVDLLIGALGALRSVVAAPSIEALEEQLALPAVLPRPSRALRPVASPASSAGVAVLAPHQQADRRSSETAPRQPRIAESRPDKRVQPDDDLDAVAETRTR